MADNDISIYNPKDESVVVYRSDDESVTLDVQLANETVWLTQQQMTLLFNSTKQNVSLHINNIFKEGELRKEATVKDYLTVTLRCQPFGHQCGGHSETSKIIPKRLNN